MSKKTIQEMFDFTGQTVVVTGGAKGIGFGIVERGLGQDQRLGQEKCFALSPWFKKIN